eukprot:TRINITY_DN82097_c0_g1_i1.p1 TRINITY_DN82097_c0_g1~~TRINITY_DN82097_c0_g1_i1.p1  ORF type:complete len:244 (+),score=19.19 TRINITY_DN82097_c0_g1_i1:44-733(+)
MTFKTVHDKKRGSESRIDMEQTARICLLDKSSGSKPIHLDPRTPAIFRESCPWPTRNLISNAFFLSDFLSFDWKKVSSEPLTIQEKAAALDLFATLDFNKNGTLDHREVRRFAQSMPAEYRPVLGNHASRLAQVEGNSNDAVSAVTTQRIVHESSIAKIGSLSDHMQILDANQKGRLSADDFLRWIKLRKMCSAAADPPIRHMCSVWRQAYLDSIPGYARIPIISHLLW